MSRWWRAYSQALDDSKLQQLSAEAFRAWFNLMCLAALNNGILPSMKALSFRLRMRSDRCQKIIDKLVNARLLDQKDGVLRPHDWETWQYQSDSSLQRVKRHREKRVAAGLASQWSAPRKLRHAVYERDKFVCVYCGGKDKLSLDHRIPEIKGGTHDLENLATACISCNGAKRDMTEDEFRKRISNGDVTLLKRPQTTETDNRKKESCSNEFERFWKAYPRRVGKKVAEKALTKALRETTIEAITEALARQVPLWTDPKFIPHPASWLNAGRWSDDIGYVNGAPRKVFSPEEIEAGRKWYRRKQAEAAE